ncbi:type II secretion system protein [Tersicoccus sp. MR15.9]|uniref:type II secretion system protein n=1 Tax=Tersicoccus mangrovi TaxID=3121635 RepID=UPI002FE6613F
MLQLLDPAQFRARALGRVPSETGRRRDAGFGFIETIATMAIVAILSLAAFPQFGKYFERAAVQNLSQEVSNAAQATISDNSLTGSAVFNGPQVLASACGIKKDTGTSFATSASGSDFSIQGVNSSVTHYSVTYDSSQGGVKVAALAQGDPHPSGSCPTS